MFVDRTLLFFFFNLIGDLLNKISQNRTTLWYFYYKVCETRESSFFQKLRKNYNMPSRRLEV